MHQVVKQIYIYQFSSVFTNWKIMEKILLRIFISNFLCSCFQTAAFPTKASESFIIHYLEDRRIIPVRIELNTDQQTEHILSPKGEETLYDFNQGKVAYKDTNSSQCFIADIAEESLEGDRMRLRNLRNGIVRDFYLPTFIIQEESIRGVQLLEKFGDLLTQFCDGSVVSTVARQKHRRKRDTSGEKGQFTHHSYGHYGHQSNNYAHYGHETYVAGSVDKDGRIRNQQVSHQQVRSESSQGYPDQSSRNGPQVSTTDSRMGISSPQSQTQYQMPNYQQTFDGNGRNFGTGGSGQFSLQTAQESGYQLNLPLGLRAGNIYRGGIRSAGQYGVGGLQPQITTQYQKYPTSIHSTVDRPGDLSQISPAVSSMPGFPYPSSTLTQTGLTSEDQRKIRHRTTLPGYRDLDQSGLSQRLPDISGTGLETLPTLTQPGITAPISTPTIGERRIERPTGIRGTGASDIQTDLRSFVPSGQRQPGVDQLDYESKDKKYVDQRVINGHRIPTRTDHSEFKSTLYPVGPGISVPGIQTQPRISMPPVHIPESRVQTPLDLSGQTATGVTIPETSISGLGIRTPGFHPGMPSMHRPGSIIPSSLGLPGQISTGIDIPGTQTTGMQPVSGISQPSYQIPGTDRDLRHQQEYTPSSVIPRQQFVQRPGITYPSGYGINGDIGMRSQIPVPYPSATIPGHISSDKQGVVHTPQPVSAIPGARSTLPGTLTGHEQTTKNGIRYPDGLYDQQTQRGIGEYPGTDVSQRISGTPGDTRGTPITSIRPGDMQFLPRGTGPIPPGGYQIPAHTLLQGETVPQSTTRDTRIPSRRTSPELLEPGDRRITDQIGLESSRLYGQDSAASQTQIQTGVEGTAAEASAAGTYRGLGSQTQVQGGYAGNGSFSAQAQSGFIGGVVQSQVQGSKLGGLSGSSAQVERVGSAQSQVQVGQPSGAASSSAQGRFSGGTTQVQAQSGKSGGSAGAQAQSTGLSSSHVQVNIGGKDVSEQERFQGTVSASVHGGHSSGQSQTQLQGGYESGRTYVATAQGGFDSSLGFQASVPVVGSLTRLSNRTLRNGHPSSMVTSGRPLHTVGGRPAVGSPAFRVPTGFDLGEKPISETTKLSSRDQVASPVSTVYTHPSDTLLGQRHLESGRLPPQQLPRAAVPHQVLFPPSSRTQESTIRYPPLTSDVQRPSYVLPSSQTAQYPHSGYPVDVDGIPTGTVDEKRILTSPGFPGYRRYDQNGILPPGIAPGAQQIGTSGIPGYHVGAMRPSTYLPGTIQSGVQESSLYMPGLKPEIPRDLAHQPSIGPTSQRPTDQQYNYTAGSLPDLSPQQPSASIFPQTRHSTTFGAEYIPGYPSSLVPQLQRPGLQTDQITRFRPGSLPGLQTEHYPLPSLFPSQIQISPPRPQTIPSHKRPDEIPVLTRPDATHPFGLQPSVYPPTSSGPGQPQISPPSIVFSAQPQISPPRPQATPSHERPGETPVLTRPDATHPSGPRPSLLPPPTSPEQSQLRPIQPQISPTPRVSVSGMPTPTDTTDIRRTERPGVSEPDMSNCCEALRDLKRRCCDRTSKRDRDSSCCKSTSRDDIFDFSSEDDLYDGKSDEPCKIVKAICYIVYKPAGKARVCKPTQTNGC